MAEQMVRACAEQESEACADKQRWSEHSADGAGTESSSGGQYFENEDDRECLPEPFATQNPTYRAVTIAADFRMQYSQPTYYEAANTHLYVNRRSDAANPFFGCAQQPNEPWREETCAAAQQKIGSDLPIAAELERRGFVKRISPSKSAGGQPRADYRKNQRAKKFPCPQTEHT